MRSGSIALRGVDPADEHPAVVAHIPLDNRQAGIARFLLQADGPTSVEAIAGAIGLTARVVRYNLPSVAAYLASCDVRLVRRRGVGVWASSADAAGRAALLAALDAEVGTRVMAAADRQRRVLVSLLDRAPEPIHLAELEANLGASRPTVRRDVRVAEPWLAEHNLHLQRLPGVGVVVRGAEMDIRRGLLAILLDTAAPEALLGLDLRLHAEIIAAQLGVLDEDDPMRSVATLYLAIVTRRVRAGRGAELQSGQLRSLIDHPVADAAARIAAAVEERAGLAMNQAEVAAITEFMLGFVEPAGSDGEPEADDAGLVDRLVGAAAAQLHPSLADDDQLRRSLADHLRRLSVRLRYGLPVSNPLDHEVRERYPDVYDVALRAVEDSGRTGVDLIPAEEIGYLTMYIAGSLERNRLRPKVRVAVVCPAGMATAWILVSRLLAIFPQVDVTRVVSKADYERAPGEEEADLVVSTVPLEHDEGRVPSVIVSPLLRDADVRRLSRVLGEPTR